MPKLIAFATRRWSRVFLLGDGVIGCWVLGNNYRGSGYYGAYPPTLLARLYALFPDLADLRALHLCSGSLTAAQHPRAIRLDRNQTLQPSLVADVKAIPLADASIDVVFADPPYAPQCALKYGFPMLNRRLVLREVARVVAPGGLVAWLDVQTPMYRKIEWRERGLFMVRRSTNHVFRGVTLFERV